jgi:hypothetical protein
MFLRVVWIKMLHLLFAAFGSTNPALIKEQELSIPWINNK